MTVPFIVPAYGAILALIYLALSWRVSQVRGRAGVMLGTGGDPALERAVRAHGNFAEYVPLALLLLGFLEMQRTSSYALHLLCLMLLIGRIAHVFGISPARPWIALRIVGMVLTYLVLIAAAVMLLYDYSLAARL